MAVKAYRMLWSEEEWAWTLDGVANGPMLLDEDVRFSWELAMRYARSLDDAGEGFQITTVFK